MKQSFVSAGLALAGVAAASMSICDKYTAALLKDNTAANQLTVVTLLVKTAALGNFTGPGSKNPSLPGSMVDVPGLLAPGKLDGEKVNLVPYFSGALKSTNVNGKPEAVDWLDNGSADDLTSNVTSAGTPGTHGYVLFTHLVEYFGVLLGCSQVGSSGFPAYGGSNDMAAVHQYMQLSEAEFGWFVENVGLSAASFGVSKSDIKTVATALNTLFGHRCSAPAMVVPDTPKLPQAICQASSCPEASPADCGAYAMESAPASASMTMSAPATIMPATSMIPSNSSAMMSGTSAPSASMPVASSATSSSPPIASGNAAPIVNAAGYLLVSGPLMAMLL